MAGRTVAEYWCRLDDTKFLAQQQHQRYIYNTPNTTGSLHRAAIVASANTNTTILQNRQHATEIIETNPRRSSPLLLARSVAEPASLETEQNSYFAQSFHLFINAIKIICDTYLLRSEGGTIFPLPLLIWTSRTCRARRASVGKGGMDFFNLPQPLQWHWYSASDGSIDLKCVWTCPEPSWMQWSIQSVISSNCQSHVSQQHSYICLCNYNLFRCFVTSFSDRKKQ